MNALAIDTRTVIAAVETHKPVFDVDASLFAAALELAATRHAGQVDKIGHPYVWHVSRVAARVAAFPGAKISQVIIALLHDIIEDTDVTAEDLLEWGFPQFIVDGIELMTRRGGVPAEEYYAALAANPDVALVKLADIADNTDPDRAAVLDDATRDRLHRKYTKAVAAVGGPHAITDLEALATWLPRPVAA